MSAPYGDLIHKQHQGQEGLEILGRTMRSYVPPVSHITLCWDTDLRRGEGCERRQKLFPVCY